MASKALLIAATLLLVFPACNINSELAERRRPSFDRNEASAMVGRRIRCKRQYDPSLDSKPATRIAATVYAKTGLGLDYVNARAGKSPQEGGPSSNITEGDLGTIAGIIPVPDGGYFITVQWDDPAGGPPLISYCGRATYRIFLEPV
ncbi:MAG TPA: hypothetical protein VI756_21825 [Blastocatellia bacterium]